VIKVKIIQGHVLDALKQIPDNSVDCIVTSPPYWGLRKYPDSANLQWDDGWYGQLGLEPTLEMYIEHLLQITKELKRVLKSSGVMFWNHGDSYAGPMGKHKGWSYVSNLGNKKDGTAITFEGRTNLPAKCETLQNFRLALRMIDEQGWILRNVIIWYKPNHLPESVKDRFARAYEPVFMFVKSKKYFFNLDAVREPLKTLKNHSFNIRAIEEEIKKYDKQGKLIIKERSGKYKESEVNSPGGREWYIIKERKLPSAKEIYEYLKYWKEKSGLTLGQIKEFFKDTGDKVSHWFTDPSSEHGFAYPSKEDWLKLKELLKFDNTYDEAMTEEYPFFVTDFGKEELTKYDINYEDIKSDSNSELTIGGIGRFFVWQREKGRVSNVLGKNPGDVWAINTEPFRDAHFAIFPTELVRRCIKAGCPEDGVVLDPFAGSGTTIKVAIEEKRNAIGIEIVPEYVEMAEKRCNLVGNPFIEYEKIVLGDKK
jgi:DNA modification methylase